MIYVILSDVEDYLTDEGIDIRRKITHVDSQSYILLKTSCMMLTIQGDVLSNDIYVKHFCKMYLQLYFVMVY